MRERRDSPTSLTKRASVTRRVKNTAYRVGIILLSSKAWSLAPKNYNPKIDTSEYLPLPKYDICFKWHYSILISFYVRYSTMLHLPTLRFHCVGGCWDYSCKWRAGKVLRPKNRNNFKKTMPKSLRPSRNLPPIGFSSIQLLGGGGGGWSQRATIGAENLRLSSLSYVFFAWLWGVRRRGRGWGWRAGGGGVGDPATAAQTSQSPARIDKKDRWKDR